MCYNNPIPPSVNPIQSRRQRMFPMTAAKKPAPLTVAAPDPAMAEQLREVLAAAQQRMAIAAIAAPERERAAEPGAAAAG